MLDLHEKYKSSKEYWRISFWLFWTPAIHESAYNKLVDLGYLFVYEDILKRTPL